MRTPPRSRAWRCRWAVSWLSLAPLRFSIAPRARVDGAVARRPCELAGWNAGAVRPDCAVRSAVGRIETVAAVERAQNRGRAGPAAGDVFDFPAEFGTFAPELLAPDPRSAGVLAPHRRVGLGHGPAVLPGGLDLISIEVHGYE